jgi:hypothetical protein
MLKLWKSLTVNFDQETYDKIMELAMKESIGKQRRVSAGEWIRNACKREVEKGREG